MSPVLLAALALQTAPATIDDVSWMAGYWLSCDGGREVSETWSDPRGGVMAGVTLTVGRSGRGSVEFTRIAVVDGRLAFLAQPNGVPATVFPMIESAPGRAVFENPDHDFPQRVIYSREGDVLTGRIEGVFDGQPQSVSWTYRSAPLNSRCPA
jgi:hypothetical protein